MQAASPLDWRVYRAFALGFLVMVVAAVVCLMDFNPQGGRVPV